VNIGPDHGFRPCRALQGATRPKASFTPSSGLTPIAGGGTATPAPAGPNRDAGDPGGRFFGSASPPWLEEELGKRYAHDRPLRRRHRPAPERVGTPPARPGRPAPHPAHRAGDEDQPLAPRGALTTTALAALDRLPARLHSPSSSPAPGGSRSTWTTSAAASGSPPSKPPGSPDRRASTTCALPSPRTRSPRGLTLHELARVMGTSVRMIELHYGRSWRAPTRRCSPASNSPSRARGSVWATTRPPARAALGTQRRMAPGMERTGIEPVTSGLQSPNGLSAR
jgi:hypothetical protein